jgi:hypothetical protein
MNSRIAMTEPERTTQHPATARHRRRGLRTAGIAGAVILVVCASAFTGYWRLLPPADVGSQTPVAVSEAANSRDAAVKPPRAAKASQVIAGQQLDDVARAPVASAIVPDRIATGRERQELRFEAAHHALELIIKDGGRTFDRPDLLVLVPRAYATSSTAELPSVEIVSAPASRPTLADASPAQAVALADGEVAVSMSLLPRARPRRPERHSLDDESPHAAAKSATTSLARAAPAVEPVEPRRTLGVPSTDEEKEILWPGKGSRVAVYDVSGGTVYLPNGERLEAHSGVGPMRDNPKHAHVKMRGPTPPATYVLRLREARFHGVEAIRLLPVDGVHPLGRDGLLAHSYMLRVPGDSNGCVAFADYKRFLNAFKAGKITHMIVVARLPKSPTQIARLFPATRVSEDQPRTLLIGHKS